MVAILALLVRAFRSATIPFVVMLRYRNRVALGAFLCLNEVDFTAAGLDWILWGDFAAVATNHCHLMLQTEKDLSRLTYSHS